MEKQILPVSGRNRWFVALIVWGKEFSLESHIGINMKYNKIAPLAVILGLATAEFVRYLTRWNYNVFSDSFEFKKVIVEFGVPIGATLAWLWIIESFLKSRNK